jgi:PPP family 3-phenylpropionic acid transporter
MVALSLFWLLSMGAMGIFFPFYALYLGENAGLSAGEIGAVFATVPAASLFAPTLWGRLADRRGQRPPILAAVAAGTSVGFASLAFADKFVPILVLTALLACFSTATIPLGVSASLGALGPEAHERFGRVRVWGTVGYLFFVVAFPPLLRCLRPLGGSVPDPRRPSEPGLELMFAAAAALALLAAAAATRIREPVIAPHERPRGSTRALLAHRPMRRILVFGFLAYFFLQGPMNFFPAYVRSRGGDLATVSWMWVYMLLPEIPLVALAGTGLRRLGARGLLAVGLLAGGLRWSLCAFAADLRVVAALQVLHGAVVTGLLMGGPLYVDAVAPEHLRSTAQGLLAAASVGIGGSASSLVTGTVLDRFGIDAAYFFGGAGALIVGLLTSTILPAPARPEPDPSP